MPDIPSWSDIFRVGRDEALSRNAKLSRNAIEREGMDANILIAVAAGMADEIAGQLADLSASLFLDSATEEDLDRLVFDRYGLVRKAAAPAIGSVSFTTTVASPTTFSLPSGIVVQTAAGLQFVTTESAIFTVGTTGPVVVAVRSVLAGADQDAKIGEINSIVSSVSGSPTDLAVTNSLATTGGEDEETDDALRERARRFFTTARQGTLAAIEAAALGVAGIQTASTFEVLDALGRPARFVQLVVADQFTEQFVTYDTIPPGFETQSQAITTAINAALSDVRPAGTFVQVIVANTVIQPVQLTLAFQAGADVNLVALQARAAVVNVTNALAPGDPLVVNDLLAALQLVPGLNYTGDEILSPAGDVVAQPLQVIRTTLGLVSAVSAQTDTPITTGSNPDSFLLATN